MKPPDANDILREDGVDALRRIIDATPAQKIPQADPPPKVAAAVLPASVALKRREFNIERWRDIKFSVVDEWLIKRILPRRGLAVIYGKPGAFKNFIALFIGLCVALGRAFAGCKTVKGTVVYIGAEGAAGLRKRKAGYVRAWDDLSPDVDFVLIPAAPNFGVNLGDLPALIAAIDSEKIKPVLIVVDTVAKTIGAADENGVGMAAFVGNAGELAAHFDCLVLAVHHVGLGEGAQQRMRGHSSLHGALDAQILCERIEGQTDATITLMKLKDEASDVKLTARLSRVFVGHDEDGDEASTLIVKEITVADARPAQTPSVPKVPRSKRLLRDILVQALNEAGEDLMPAKDGPTIRAVDVERVRERYYAAIAEKAGPDEGPDKLAERQRKAFSRAVKSMLDAKEAFAREVADRRMLWTL